jgi:membrane protein YqaA with SNARE-associated domain
MSELGLLFVSAFIAATLLPLGSEVALYTLLQRGLDPAALVLVATLGNTLGSLVNWVLGKYLQQLQHKRWFYFSETQVNKAQVHFQRFGRYSLLFAWLPVVGDLLTLAAGIFNVRAVPFLLLVGTGKLLRYLAVVYLGSAT